MPEAAPLNSPSTITAALGGAETATHSQKPTAIELPEQGQEQGQEQQETPAVTRGNNREDCEDDEVMAEEEYGNILRFCCGPRRVST